jgi:pilus assembly protein Flp/PilA
MTRMTPANTPTAKLRPMRAWLRARIANDSGATAIEYALIAAGIGVAVAATVYSLGTATKGLFANIAALM